MNINFFPLRSLAARLTLASLAVLLLAIWSLSFYVSNTMQDDLREAMSERQLSTVSVLASEIEHEVAFRAKSIAVAAANISPAILDDAKPLQAYLDSLFVLNVMFNAGAIIIDAKGEVRANSPSVIKRVGVNYSDRDYFVAAMKGEASISEPMLGRVIGTPVFVMAVPIRDEKGQVIGVLAGVTDLAKSNFLDSIVEHSYGKTGGYMLITRQHKLIVAATNKSLAVKKASRIDSLMERFTNGDEGSGVFVNSSGVETLSSIKSIPTAGWLLMAELPTQEAFAPIRGMQLRTLMATMVLSFFACGLILWLIRHQLAPMLKATKALAQLSIDGAFPHALPVLKNDEVGALISGFNRLLHTLQQREDTLRFSEKNLAITLESIGDAVIATDAIGHITRMNSTAERLTGCLLSDALGQPLSEVFRIINAQNRMACTNPVELVMQHGNVIALANHTALLARDGSEYQIADSAAPIRDASGQIVGVVLVFSDITEKYKAQQALQYAQQRFRDLVESTDGIVWEADAITFAFNSVSKNAERMLGFPVNDWLVPGFWVSRIDEADRDYAVNYCASCTGRLEDHDFEYRFVAQDGRIVWLRDIVRVVAEDGKPRWLRGLMLDITVQKHEQEILQKTLREKTSLLNEVHHRVKNNLQVITSLLRLEAGRSDQHGVKTVLADMQGRIRSMALLHESLYRSGIFASADLAHYLRELATQVFRAQANTGNGVELKLDLASVTVSMDQATPCGLLVNELISNCLKHGFPNGRKGEVMLTLSLMPDAHHAVMTVSDNGVGLPADFELKRKASLGLQLASDLAIQIGGWLEIGPGSVFRVVFPVNDV